MKKMIFLMLLSLPGIAAMACPACEKQQPKLLRGITHGAGPSGPLDMILVWLMVGVVVLTLFYSVKWLIKPGEKSPDHIKRFILNNE
jgi:hypothetical protein